MLSSLAVDNYRSLRRLVVPLGALNLVTGANGSGKSNLYRALRLLAETAQGGVVNALAAEGGLSSTFWAGPENITRAMRTREHPVQGGPRQHALRLRLGFSAEDFSYAIALGLPSPSSSLFALDPEIKGEWIWSGTVHRPATALIAREGALVRTRADREWHILARDLASFDSIFTQLADPQRAPEILTLRERIKGWRFYDHFRTDNAAPTRTNRLGTRTPVLHHDGRDLAAALATIREIGDGVALDAAISDAFPGAQLSIEGEAGNHLALAFRQDGLLRPLSAMELSDGTLRYLLWVAALLTPRPPPLMVLNEPETSLHPDLLPALARLIGLAALRTQVWVVSHASRLIAALEADPRCHTIELEKVLGASAVRDQGLLDAPPWRWPDAG